MRSVSRALTMAVVCGLAAGVSGQTVYPESAEPNDSKAQATVVTGLVHGDRLTGQTRGATINGGLISPDYFRVSPAPLPPGIYRHQINLVTSPVAGIMTGLRGCDQNGLGVINPATDIQVQTGVVLANTTISNTWYGFGRSEQLYLRVQGGGSSPVYTLEFTTTPVEVTEIAGTFAEGQIMLLVEAGFGNPDAEIWVYDSALNPIPWGNNDDPITPVNSLDRASIIHDFAPGTYYMAVGTANMANNLPSPPGELTPADDEALDFPGALTPAGGMVVSRFGNITVMDQVGVVTLVQEPVNQAARWYRFQVVSGCDPAQFAFGPSSMSVTASYPVLFESLATGTDPIAYQWRRNGVDIPGATQATYSIAAATLNDAASYTVVATNACGQAESGAAVLSVMPLGPTITSQPQPQAACVGSTATFTVAGDGHLGAPLSFQWRKDGIALPLGQSPVLEVQVTGLGDGGLYDCEVTEPGAGSTTSDAALLTVKNDPPAIALIGSETMMVQLGTAYTEPGATASDDCDPVVAVVIGGDTVNTATGGLYVVTYDATDSQGNAAATVNRYVHVVDGVPPKVKAWVQMPLMWPPNHWMRNVGLKSWAQDAGDPGVTGASVQFRVFCDEPELSVTGDGTGLHSPDAKAMQAGKMRLRAERRNGANGRVYLIMGTAKDASGNVGYGFATVVCPSSLRPSAVCNAIAQAKAIRKKAEELAKSAVNPDGLAAALTSQGFVEHGLAPKAGRFQ